LRPWLAVLFFGGAFLVCVTGAAELMLNPTETRMQAVYVNVGVMAGLAMAIAIQNYRIKFRELAALDAARRDNETLQQANRAMTLSSETDDLTKLLNRRALDRDLDQLQQKRISYVLAMIDIDYFKAFNDHYGHQAGDRALQAVALCLKEGLNRRSDRVYRYGGEEFAVLLRDTDLRGGWIALEALRERVETLGIEHAHRSDDAAVITISAGIAASDNDARETILERADRCLYQSKAAGRNRVMSVPEPEH
jgi:diguanylate cyclase (GGDEF)-like protein